MLSDHVVNQISIVDLTARRYIDLITKDQCSEHTVTFYNIAYFDYYSKITFRQNSTIV